MQATVSIACLEDLEDDVLEVGGDIAARDARVPVDHHLRIIRRRSSTDRWIGALNDRCLQFCRGSPSITTCHPTSNPPV